MATLEESCLATYYIETKSDLAQVAETLAELETTGKWSGGGEPSELFRRCRGEVYDVREHEKGKGEVDILLPLINFDLEKSAFPNLWLAMIGGATHALLEYEKSRLLDFSLPDWAYSYFPGPRFGLEGTREILAVEERELIIGTIVKPTAGLTPQEVAHICYEAALGGVRFIKDDEKMMNASYCPLGERVRTVSEALRRAEDRIDQKVLYAPHITTSPDHILEVAREALANGANALMLNIFAAGFTALGSLAEDESINVPLYAHCGGKEALGRATGQGVDPVVVAKFARLMGGDYFRVSTLGGYLVGATKPELEALLHALRSSMGHIKGTVPAISGGLNPANLGRNLELFGLDVMALAGTGITSHPMGSRAGTIALQQAADAFREGIPVKEYARTHEELRLALGL